MNATPTRGDSRQALSLAGERGRLRNFVCPMAVMSPIFHDDGRLSEGASIHMMLTKKRERAKNYF